MYHRRFGRFIVNLMYRIVRFVWPPVRHFGFVIIFLVESKGDARLDCSCIRYTCKPAREIQTLKYILECSEWSILESTSMFEFRA